jgi:hypothetical protein
MTSPNRFADWMGNWTGTVESPDGATSLLQLRISSLFEGRCIELHATVYDTQSSSLIVRGYALYDLNENNRVEAAMWDSGMGFGMLSELPDDPGALALEGTLDGSRTLRITFAMQDDTLIISMVVFEGYEGAGAQHRQVGRLKRESLPGGTL